MNLNINELLKSRFSSLLFVLHQYHLLNKRAFTTITASTGLVVVNYEIGQCILFSELEDVSLISLASSIEKLQYERNSI